MRMSQKIIVFIYFNWNSWERPTFILKYIVFEAVIRLLKDKHLGLLDYGKKS